MKKKVWIAIGAVLVLIICAINCGGNGNEKSAVEAKDDSIKIAVATDEPKSAWHYDESTDEMTDKTAYSAWIESENSVDFDFPYNGGSYLKFYLRNSPQYGKDAYMRISKGQFDVDYSGTKVMVKFDDKEPMTLTCVEASDSSTDILFFRDGDYGKLVKCLKEAKTMKIQAPFFTEGNRTFTFNVEGLEWNH